MKKIGIIILIISFILLGFLFLVPFLPVSLSQKGIITGVLLVSSEISFWLGGFILGKEFISKLKNRFKIFMFCKKKD